MRRIALLAPALLALLALLAWRPGVARPAFPHAKHAKVFPTCAGCHAGIVSGDAGAAFPAPALCAQCHDGTIEKTVAYAGRAAASAGMLTFSHTAHFVKDTTTSCQTCHASQGAAWMNVGPPAPERCAACHTHADVPHLDPANRCARCHRPLTQATAVSDAQIAALPRPATHDAPDFVATHGAMAKNSVATCLVCHARESCARCHVNATQSPVIATLAPDPRVARLVADKLPVYPTPASHHTPEFLRTHGTLARASDASCSTCHARSSCETCHTTDATGGGATAAVLRGIPAGRDASAPGVQLRREAPIAPVNRGADFATAVHTAGLPSVPRPDTVTHSVRVHPDGFVRSHGAVAASGEMTCSGCHAQSFCSRCHAAERVTTRYHAANFLATHAPQAYGRSTDCASCHNTQVFCRGCHLQAGLAARTNTQRSPTFHNAQPLWLLKHGRAARQDLPACTTCHQQTYCMQCHSDLGARINPHGPGFDANRMAARNPQICLACHFTNPLGK